MRKSDIKQHITPRIVLYCVEPVAYQLLREWAETRGYTFRLIVTTPGPARARSMRYRQIIAEAPPEQDILVTTGMRRTAAVLAALAPDLILSFTLPYRLPREVLVLPRHGAVNLHPAPLPAYRGPNPARMIYAGEPYLGATLHRTAVDYDTGPILSRHTAPMPEEMTIAAVTATWKDLLIKALDQGVPRALADDPGMPQDGSDASYAASFTPEEFWLDWHAPAPVLQRHVTALNIELPQARARIERQDFLVEDLRSLPKEGASEPPGSVLDRSADWLIVQTGKGRAQVRVRAIHPSLSASS